MILCPRSGECHRIAGQYSENRLLERGFSKKKKKLIQKQTKTENEALICYFWYITDILGLTHDIEM